MGELLLPWHCRRVGPRRLREAGVHFERWSSNSHAILVGENKQLLLCLGVVIGGGAGVWGDLGHGSRCLGCDCLRCDFLGKDAGSGEDDRERRYQGPWHSFLHQSFRCKTKQKFCFASPSLDSRIQLSTLLWGYYCWAYFSS